MTLVAENALNSPQRRWDWIRENFNTRGVTWSTEFKGISDYKHTHLHLHLWRSKFEDVKIVWNKLFSWEHKAASVFKHSRSTSHRYMYCVCQGLKHVVFPWVEVECGVLILLMTEHRSFLYACLLQSYLIMTAGTANCLVLGGIGVQSAHP